MIFDGRKSFPGFKCLALSKICFISALPCFGKRTHDSYSCQILQGAKSGSFSIDRFHRFPLLISSSVSCVMFTKISTASDVRKPKENHVSQGSQCLI